jgi:DNA-binding IclR family transcriptional regulator
MRDKSLANRWRVLDELIEQQDWCSNRDLVHATGLHKQSVEYALRDLLMGRMVEADTDVRALTRKDGSIFIQPVQVYRAIIRRTK